MSGLTPFPLSQFISAITLLVPDYDAGIAYFVGRLGFTLVADTPLGGGKRWVLVAPPGSSGESSSTGTRLLLAQAATPEQKAAIGQQTGGRVFLFLQTDDFWRDYKYYQENGVIFCEAPRNEPYGIVAVFRDDFGNLWDLIQMISSVN